MVLCLFQLECVLCHCAVDIFPTIECKMLWKIMEDHVS